MPNSGETIKETVEQFQKIQAHMINAREENATKTYGCNNIIKHFAPACEGTH